jgi:myo-inositol 2-dehydrogenase/D-chiro-inositol 1-dehydrogenase
MLQVRFVGAGFIAGMHAGILRSMPDIAIAGVFDPNAAQAEAFASEHDVQPMPSFDALLSGCDAVYICAPNALHAELAIDALEAGKHVFSEKPLAVTVEDAHRVRDAAARASGVYQIGFNKRFAKTYVELKRRIDVGELTPRAALLKMNRGELQNPAWVGDASLTGGFLYETPIHILDLACWLFGTVREVYCRATDTLDDFSATLTFASGVIATFTSSARTTWLYPYERVEVYGEHQIAATEEMDRVTFQLGLDAQPETLDVGELAPADRWGYRAEDEAFVSALRGGSQRGPGVEEGVRAVELVYALYRSAAGGGVVRLA